MGAGQKAGTCKTTCPVKINKLSLNRWNKLNEENASEKET